MIYDSWHDLRPNKIRYKSYTDMKIGLCTLRIHFKHQCAINYPDVQYIMSTRLSCGKFISKLKGIKFFIKMKLSRFLFLWVFCSVNLFYLKQFGVYKNCKRRNRARPVDPKIFGLMRLHFDHKVC